MVRIQYNLNFTDLTRFLKVFSMLDLILYFVFLLNGNRVFASFIIDSRTTT